MKEPARQSRRDPAKRKAILQAATETFLRDGYERTSVDAIAAAAGVGKQTVYGHFGDKQRLFLAVVEAANKSVGTAIGVEAESVVNDSGDPRFDLENAGVNLLRGITAPEIMALHRLTISEFPHHPELLRLWRDNGPSQTIIDSVAKYLRICHDRGDLHVPNPALVARQFVMLLSVEGQVRSLRGGEPLSPQSMQQIAHDTTDLILRASRTLPNSV